MLYRDIISWEKFKKTMENKKFLIKLVPILIQPTYSLFKSKPIKFSNFSKYINNISGKKF